MTEPMREGLPPVLADGARILVLGSFPSELSLVAGEYYANPRNQFWRLLGSVFDFDPDAPYAERIAAATSRGVALWDVVHSCRRKGSMDVKIDRKTLVVNDFGPVFARHPGITQVFANGLTAFDLFERHADTPARRPIAVEQWRAADVVCGQADAMARDHRDLTTASRFVCHA